MGSETGIAWTDATWNPIRGCSRISEGCRNCYAERVAARYSARGLPYHGFAEPGRGWTGRVELVPRMLDAPLRWKRRRLIFVNSMSDLFHESLDRDSILRVFSVMARAPHHTFQVLTKRPARMLDFVRWMDGLGLGPDGKARSRGAMYWNEETGETPWPLPNVWLGVSVEDQKTADARIPLLLATPAAVRFVSYEPALERVDFGETGALGCDCLPQEQDDGSVEERCSGRCVFARYALDRTRRVDWIIVGGESGPRARPFDIAWARSTVEQCRAAGVKCFVKQLGAKPIDREIDPRLVEALPRFKGGYASLMLCDKKGGDWREWPEDLRVREFPFGAASTASAEP